MRTPARTEKRILKAALELFVRKGYHGTSISDICTEVGVTKGALYAHFSAKGELLLQLIDEFKSRFIGGMIQALTECEGTALDKIHQVITFNSRFAVENQELCVFQTFLTTELHADVDFEPALRQVYHEYRKIIADLVRQGASQGLFKRELDPELAALTFMALHDGVLHQWTLNKDQVDGEAYVRTFREIFLHGLASQGPRCSRA